MNKFLVSEEAYNEFKAFLVENEVENFSIRINLAGFGCSGPAFNITVDEAKEGDISEKINDITLIAEEKLVDEFGGFRLLSSEENGGRGLSLKPVIEVEGGCGSCGGGCHHLFSYVKLYSTYLLLISSIPFSISIQYSLLIINFSFLLSLTLQFSL